MRYLTASLLDEVTAVLDVRQQIRVGKIEDADGLVEKQVWKCVLNAEGYIQDVRHLMMRKRSRRIHCHDENIV